MITDLQKIRPRLQRSLYKLSGVIRRRRRDYLVGVSLLHDPARFHYQEAMAERLNQSQIMADKQVLLQRISDRQSSKLESPSYNAESKKRDTLVPLCKRTPGYCSTLIERDGWVIKDDYPHKI